MYFLLFRIFTQLAFALKIRIALKIFTVFKYFLSFRIFGQLALALKTELALKFFNPGGASASPRPPASYAYWSNHCQLNVNQCCFAISTTGENKLTHLHIKLGLFIQYVKTLNKRSPVFNFVKTTCTI